MSVGPPSSGSTPATQPVLRVIRPGLELTIQHRPRRGFRRYGVPPGGPMDPLAAAWANRLVDNPLDAPVLEILLNGAELEVLEPLWLGLAGADMQGTLPAWTAQAFHPGQHLRFPIPRSGVWSYLATPGGFEAHRLLGSAGSSPRAGLGNPLAPGELLRASTRRPVLNSAVRQRQIPGPARPTQPNPSALRAFPGPHWELFREGDRTRFLNQTWTLTSRCDRTGYRLAGTPVLPQTREMISEPVLPGTVQLPPDGQPVITMPDGPVTGGYPALLFLAPESMPRLAQTRAGASLRFQLSGDP